MREFFNRVKREWNKISWTKQKDVIKQTELVVGSAAILGVLIAGIDVCGQWLVNILINFHF